MSLVILLLHATLPVASDVPASSANVQLSVSVNGLPLADRPFLDQTHQWLVPNQPPPFFLLFSSFLNVCGLRGRAKPLWRSEIWSEFRRVDATSLPRVEQSADTCYALMMRTAPLLGHQS